MHTNKIIMLGATGAVGKMPFIGPLLIDSLKKYRSIAVEKLGTAIAINAVKNTDNSGTEDLFWSDFIELSEDKS